MKWFVWYLFKDRISGGEEKGSDLGESGEGEGLEFVGARFREGVGDSFFRSSVALARGRIVKKLV